MNFKKLIPVIMLITAFLLGGIIAYFTTYKKSPVTPPVSHTKDELIVHFIDVGQADCQLISLPTGQTMLIDAGNNDDSELIVGYIDNLGIEKIDYLVGTHPHEDHIGSMDTVINTYDIGSIYMPDAIADSATYEDVLYAMEKKHLSPIITKSGMVIYSDDTLKIEAVAPTKDYGEDLNNQSIVIRITYKKSSFLFTGDAEEISENDITMEVSADVLSVGHHGSSSSTSQDFLERVDPMYAVISCGKNNSYGHPHREVLDRLSENDVTVYRTDTDGTLICSTKGSGPADYKWEMVK